MSLQMSLQIVEFLSNHSATAGWPQGLKRGIPTPPSEPGRPIVLFLEPPEPGRPIL
jgi:hypothetical protein